MKSIKTFASCRLIKIAALLLAACTNQMEPARQALDQINIAVAAAIEDGSTYVPDQLTHVQKELTDLQSSYDKSDYAAVLARAPAVLAEAKTLAADAAAKKDEITKTQDTEWSELAASLPRSITAVEERVGTLSKLKRLPKGIDLAAAKAGLADAQDGWARAQAAKASGEVGNAIATAKDVKSKIDIAAAALKLALPASDK